MAALVLSAPGVSSDFARLAIKMLTRFGSAGQFHRTPTVGAYDPALGRAPAGPVEVYPTTCAAGQWTFTHRPGTSQAAGAERVLVAAEGLGIEPNPELDILIWNGMRLAIAGGIIIAPNGTAILYDLECVGVIAKPS